MRCFQSTLYVSNLENNLFWRKNHVLGCISKKKFGETFPGAPILSNSIYISSKQLTSGASPQALTLILTMADSFDFHYRLMVGKGRDRFH